MEVVSVGIDEVFQDPNNANTHDQKSIDAIKGSLKKFGQQKPIVLGEGDIILAGNGTATAAKQLGWDKIAVVRSNLKNFQAMAYALADNQTAKLAEFDDVKLNSQIDLIADSDLDIDFSDFGFDGVSSGDIDDLPPDISDDDHDIYKMTFELHNDQAEIIKEIVKDISAEDYKSNQNRNGNALFKVMTEWVELRK